MFYAPREGLRSPANLPERASAERRNRSTEKNSASRYSGRPEKSATLLLAVLEAPVAVAR